MLLKKFPYTSLKTLLTDNLSKEEDLHTRNLIKTLKAAKKRGWLNKQELIEICYWKSPRAIRHIESNHSQTIKRLTRLAFKSRIESKKIEELINLKGVSIPMASAILMLTNPRKYGVIDIRVWEVIHKIGLVNTNSKGINFTVKEWQELLTIFWHYSKSFKVSVRDIERTIFIVHKNHQEGTLYKKNISKI